MKKIIAPLAVAGSLLFLSSCVTSPGVVPATGTPGAPGLPPGAPVKLACPEGDQSQGESDGPGDIKILFCAKRAFQETPAGTWSDLYVWTLNKSTQDLNRIVLAEKDESVTFTPETTQAFQWIVRHHVSFPTIDLQGYSLQPLSEKKLVCQDTGCTVEKEQCKLSIPENPFPKLMSELKLPKRPSRRSRKKGVIPSKPMVDPLLTRKLLYRSLDGDKMAQRLLSEIHLYYSMDTSMATEAIQNVALFRRAQRIGCVKVR